MSSSNLSPRKDLKEVVAKPRKDLKEVAENWRLSADGRYNQDMLWTMYLAAVGSSDADDWSPMFRSNMCYLFHKLHNLMHELDPENSREKLSLLPIGEDHV